MHPLVSVIIPNYNHAQYLRERIESVLNQSFDDFEVILLDDCSTDNSCEILDEYRNHPKVCHVVFNSKNSGTTFAQWKNGLELTNGKYIWIAESDDSADKAFLSTLVAQLQEHPDAVIAFSGSRIIDSMSNDIPGRDWDHFGSRLGTTHIYSAEEFISRKLLRNNLLYNASMAVFRKDAAPKITSRYLSMKFCGDWLFWSQLGQQGSAIEVCKKLNNFRQHSIKVSNSAAKEGKTYTEGLPIVNEMANWLKLSPIQRKVIAGRICKRLRKFPGLLNSDTKLQDELKKLASTTSLYPPLLSLLYEADKLLKFSHLPNQAR